MYSDLLDVLGGGPGMNAGNHPRESDKHVVVTFKAGKMNMALRENGKYWVTPDTRRGELQLVWQDAALKLEWLDRREPTVVDSYVISDNNNHTNHTFERIPAKLEKDRVYLWTHTTSTTTERHMFWMQTAEDAGDDDVVAQVNQYLMNPSEAAPETSSGATAGVVSSNANAMMQQGSSSTDAASSSSTPSSTTGQVDALSNILENLGMPQQQQQGAGSTTTATSAAAATAPTGTLTLADLQGAMAGLATASPPPNNNNRSSTTGPPLPEVVTPAAISALLEDEAVVRRLTQLLPPEQQQSNSSQQYLEDNLRSPQIQQTLRTLTALVQPDDAGSMEGYHSLLANFQLDPEHGEETLRTTGNPIQAFLDCVVASVQKEQEEREEGKDNDDDAKEEESKEEEEEKEDAMQE